MNATPLRLFVIVALAVASCSFVRAAESSTEPASKALFDGQTLAGWKPTGYAAGGAVKVEKGLLIIEQGETLSGITWTNPVVRMNYEISLEAMRVNGSDFFCGLTFPIGTNCMTLVMGGWGGSVTGVSSIDHQDASENETTKYVKYDSNKWYKVRLRITPKKIEAWLDDDKVVDYETAGHHLGMRPGDIEDSQPLGLATYQTTASFRNIQLRLLEPAK